MSFFSIRTWVAFGAVALSANAALAETDFDYNLTPVQVAKNTYVVIGKTEHFTRENGGNAVNTGFIVTEDGVVVIDTGPNAAYGGNLRDAIAKITDKAIVRVLNTHLHPDHFLGNQAFKDIGIHAEPGTIAGIQSSGQDFALNFYRLVGDWMLGTEPLTPNHVLDGDGERIGGHDLQYLKLSGHTEADLAVFDKTTGVLFASDLVFSDRTPTTPHADIATWLNALDRLEAVPFKVLVPGHGPVASDAKPIAQTRAYLTWMDQTLTRAIARGWSMPETMKADIPPEFAGVPLARDEFERSVVHLYPKLEQGALPKLDRPE